MTSLHENIRNIIFYYTKQKYNTYLLENNKTYIDNDELITLVDTLYIDEKSKLQEYIRSCLKDMMQNSYNSILVENLIFEIFSDEELAKNRVIMEINTYQNDKSSKNNVFNALLEIHPIHGIGLKVNFNKSDVIISNINKKSDLNESSDLNNISIGDSIIGINNIDLTTKKTQEIINIFKDATQNKTQILLTLKTYYNKLQ